MKPQAAAMIPRAMELIGTPYSKMDCQAFVEACLASIGINKNLPGSNAWYRRMDRVGTPEECRAIYGTIPKGAFLFILEQDGGEPDKYKQDGIGNASHIGIYTGEGLGAVHSSASRGEVCESKFAGKTIPNGGWNRVGLWLSALDYSIEGEEINISTFAIVTAPSGSSVKMRQSPSKSCRVYWDIPIDTIVEIFGTTGEWSWISYEGREGYMLSEYLKVIGGEPDEETDEELVEIAVRKSTAEELLRILEAALGAD